MTLTTARKKLHDIIDQADEKEIYAFLALIEDIKETAFEYDEPTLLMLRERSEEYRTGKATTFSAEESLTRLRAHRK